MTRTLLLACLLVTGPFGGGAGGQGAGTPDPVRHLELARVREATRRFQDVREAERAGYRLRAGGMDTPLMGEHWVNRALLREPTDLLRPPVLQYARVGERRVLVGVAYGRFQRPGQVPPEGFTGSEDHWHTHDVAALAMAQENGRPVRRWLARRALRSGRVTGDPARTELAMVHAWVWLDNPDGVFANHNRALPYLRAGLPTSLAAAPGDAEALAAARGVALLAPDACPRMERLAGDVLRAGADQRKALAEACRVSAGRVGRVRGEGPERLNQSAAASFRELARRTREVLTPEQLSRMSRLVGEPPVAGAAHAGH